MKRLLNQIQTNEIPRSFAPIPRGRKPAGAVAGISVATLLLGAVTACVPIVPVNNDPGRHQEVIPCGGLAGGRGFAALNVIACGPTEEPEYTPAPYETKTPFESVGPGDQLDVSVATPLPADLVGTWHGGVGDNYYLKLAEDGTYAWEHRRLGPFDGGVVVVDGSTMTLTSSVTGKSMRFRYSLSVSPEVYGFTFTTLHLGDQAYVK